MKYFYEEPVSVIYQNKESYLFSKIGMLIIIADTELQDLYSTYYGKYTKMQLYTKVK